MYREGWIAKSDCRYCNSKTGESHKDKCPSRKKTIVIKQSFEYVVIVDEKDEKEDIENNRNGIFWCADNTIRELANLFNHRLKFGGCVCELSKSEYLRDATREDEERCGMFIDDIPCDF